ncbi:DUF2325 domain-containing protein [Lactococcus kimchii]|uniref:DUF2325 domain-containing protein n=1 Tax=Lactococcus sp. S-13 TaxID=2507158 RepID=UPI0010231D86|nr:DUF2325 domain-containing protein [Lactococcus sp. S-13]RZI49662.1 DUF2325 domain-containing protein [Lactococcus sp. S-13]
MKTILVIEEAKYWGDLKAELAKMNVLFLGFDKKKPNRKEIDELVAKADFVVMRNLNVAHHSISFAKAACKKTGTPFWIGRNFGLDTIIEKFNDQFPKEKLERVKIAPKPKPKQVTSPSATPVSKHAKSASQTEQKAYLKGKKQHLPLKNALKNFQIDDDEPDFTKIFQKKR